jgi:hypothetical protein
VDRSLAVRMLDFEHHDGAAGEPWSAVVVEQILFEPTNRDLTDRLLRRLDAAREAMRIEQLQQRRERVVIPVVRRRRQK